MLEQFSSYFKASLETEIAECQAHYATQRRELEKRLKEIELADQSPEQVIDHAFTEVGQDVSSSLDDGSYLTIEPETDGDSTPTPSQESTNLGYNTLWIKPE